MKVIKHGNTYKEIECPKCGALLSYCTKDIEIDDRSDEVFCVWHDYYEEYIICPECEEKITIYKKVDGEVLKKR